MTARFDELFITAAPMLMAGQHEQDAPPVEGGRWPVSAVFRPRMDCAVSSRLDELTTEVAQLAGPGHWQTGQLGAAHLTIRALERYRERVNGCDHAIRRYLTALQAAAAQTHPVHFEVTGLTLTPGTVMACAKPLDDGAQRFRTLFADHLGEHAWLERDHYLTRDIWYLNLLHFTTTINNPTALIDWVAARRSHSLGQLTIDYAELVRFRLRPNHRPAMHPELIGSARLPIPATH